MFRPGVAILLALLAAPAGAEIYKWTDAQGKIHYGDQPPSGSIPKTFDPRTSKAAEARAQEIRRKAAQQAALERMEQAKAREEESRKQAAGEEAARRKAEICQRARGNLATLNQAYTRVRISGQGEYLDEAGRQAEIAKANRDIAENCQ